MSRRPVALAAVAACFLVLSACDSSPRGTDHQVGDESFVSSPPGGGSRGGPVLDTGGEAGAPGATPTPPSSDSCSKARAVEESDLYARLGSVLLVQNAWRGLQVVELADPAKPVLVGRVALSGTPAGLYLRGTTALVLARDHLAWTMTADGPSAQPGSRLWTVDVSNPKQPKVLKEVALDGQVQDSRLVGDVLYVFTGGWSWWGPGPMAAEGAAVADVGPWTPGDWSVASYDVSDLAAPAKVDAVTFPAATWGWDLHANVTDRRITISSASYDGAGPVTKLVAVDASDPGGDLVLGADVKVAGTVMDRWGMDLDEASGTFRVVSAEGWNQGARLTVLSWPTPGAVEKRAELHVDVAESLTSARFDGVRGYLVTAARIDPLWVVDLRDPAKPTVTGELEMPGQLDHMVPQGDRLLALGHTNEAGKPFQLHVSLIDVADPTKPALLVRRTFGPDWAFLPASADDLHKAFLAIGDLVIVPFEGWDQAAQGWVGGTQLLTHAGDALTLGGFVPHAGAIQRAFPAGAAGAGVLAAFSNEKLQTIDASDRAKPVELASIDLSRSVTSIAVAGTAAAELVGEPWRGTGELAVVPAADPDAATPIARFSTGSAWGRLFREGKIVWTFANDWRTGKTTVEAFDLTNPAAPVRRGKLVLPQPANGGWWWAGEAVKAGSALAVKQETRSCDVARCASNASLLVVDLGDPAAPRVSATVALPENAWTGTLRAVGTDVWYTQYEWRDDSAVRYFVGRISLADPDHPVRGPAVNVPGQFFSASDDGKLIYTEEVAWPEAALPGAWSPTTRLHALELTSRGTARLVGTVELDGYFYGAVRAGGYAYAAGTTWAAEPAGTVSRGRLASVDLARMRKLDVQELEAQWAQILAAAGGKLFLSQSYPIASVLVYGLPQGKPVFEQAVPTLGWTYEVVVEGGVAYLPAGPYGVVRIPLSP